MKNERNLRQKQRDLLDLQRFLNHEEKRRKKKLKELQLEEDTRRFEFANNLNVDLIKYASWLNQLNYD